MRKDFTDASASNSMRGGRQSKYHQTLGCPFVTSSF